MVGDKGKKDKDKAKVQKQRKKQRKEEERRKKDQQPKASPDHDGKLSVSPLMRLRLTG